MQPLAPPLLVRKLQTGISSWRVECGLSALARALVIEPSPLVFDKPLSNLDARLRVEMRDWIREFQRADRTAAIFVTHDQEMEFSISDRVAIMESGRIRQFDRPETLYRRPAFVARFVGFENLIHLTVTVPDANRVTAEGEGGIDITLPENKLDPIPSIPAEAAHASDIRRAADRLVTDLSSAGFKASVRDTEGHPMVVGHDTNAPDGAPHVLFSDHYDVQPGDPLEL